MKPREIDIWGAGVMGLTLAAELLRTGHRVCVWERLPREKHEMSTCFAAGGMLAPYSELESAEPLVHELGLDSLKLWPLLLQTLSQPVFYRQAGSLILAHHRDRPLFQQITHKIIQHSARDAWEWKEALELEPEIAPGFEQGLWLKDEAHLDTRELIPALVKYVEEHPEGSIEFGHELQMGLHGLPTLDRKPVPSDLWIDCRGYEAADSLADLRAVRGEAALVHAPAVEISRPIRVMHPRYAVYIVPRADHMYYIGATSIESASRAPVTIRSVLELFSAAYSLHKGFGEATVRLLLSGLRPALPHHRPEVFIHNHGLRINGLYRHGFLLAPAIAQQVRWYLEDQTSLLKSSLFRFS